MLSICSESPCFAATIAYVWPSFSNALTALAPSSRVLASAFVMRAAALGEDGSVMLMICTPSSLIAATRAYHPAPTCTMSTPCALPSVSNVPPAPSVPPSRTEATASGERGLLTSTICAPWGCAPGPRAAMTAYVRPSITAVSTPAGALSMSNLSPFASGCPSRAPETNRGRSGFDMSAIVNAPLSLNGAWSTGWPCGSSAVMMAYVLAPITNVSMPRTPCSRSNCDRSECRRADAARGFAGSVTSIICTLPPMPKLSPRTTDVYSV